MKAKEIFEPKFHKGDWIIRNNEYTGIPVQVLAFDGCYSCVLDGEVVTLMRADVYNNFHLWTIEDAKDGDILISCRCIFIFNKIDNNWVKVHCSYHHDGSLIFENYGLMTLKYKDEVFPATKEQRDILFQKMKEAGYKWYAENKELKKV